MPLDASLTGFVVYRDRSGAITSVAAGNADPGDTLTITIPGHVAGDEYYHRTRSAGGSYSPPSDAQIP